MLRLITSIFHFIPKTARRKEKQLDFKTCCEDMKKL
jgi:hypothetical protein